MNFQLINVGNENYTAVNRIISIVSAESAPIKRMISDSKDNGSLIDATCGKKTKSVIITDSSHVILSALTPDVLASKVVKGNLMMEEGQDKNE